MSSPPTTIDSLSAQGGPSQLSLFVLKRDLSIAWVHERGRSNAARAFGREPRVGDSMLDFAAPGARDSFVENAQRAFGGHETSVRRDITHPTGFRRVFDVFYEPLPDARGHIEHIAFTAVDVTADVHRADAVRLLAAGLSQTADGVLIAEGSDCNLIYANEAAEKITGYSRDELIGRNCRFLQGDDTDQPGVHEVRAAIREQRTCEVTLRNYRKNGDLFDNHFTLSPIRSTDGVVTHFVGVQRDVTEARRPQERLAASERMEALGRLASGVAHDMNNFLMAVQTNLDLIQLDAKTTDAHQVEFSQITTILKRATALAHQLLTFGRARLSTPTVVDVGLIRSRRQVASAVC